jgi:hypothetical protein
VSGAYLVVVTAVRILSSSGSSRGLAATPPGRRFRYGSKILGALGLWLPIYSWSCTRCGLGVSEFGGIPAQFWLKGVTGGPGLPRMGAI